MGELDAVGDAVTGGLLARAVEPQAGEAAGRPHARDELPQLRRALTGPYCAACGQKAHVHRSVRAFFQRFRRRRAQFRRQDLADPADARLVPGELTRRYIAGERARFISPVALYLFSRLPDVRGAQFHRRARIRSTANSSRNSAAEIAETAGQIAKIEKQRAEAIADKDRSPSSTSKIAEHKKELAQNRRRS